MYDKVYFLKKDYTDITSVYETFDFIIYRAFSFKDKKSFLLKLSKSNEADLEMEAGFLSSLYIEGVIKPSECKFYDEKPVLIMEDFGGDLLKNLIEKHAFSVKELLGFSLKITEIIEEIHRKNIIHRSINPYNILLNPESGLLKIANFDFAFSCPEEINNKSDLRLNPLYMSPEDTGRTRFRPHFYSDLYSLGITFYELFTGTPPFKGKDELEFIHSHLARVPQKPCEVNGKIPPILSDIIMKLLSKNPYDRYESVGGTGEDIRNCLKQLKDKGKILSFPLAEKDVSFRLNIKERLYGRDKEKELIFKSLNNTFSGKKEILFISGNSGTGKTFLVKEFFKSLKNKKLFFLSGKFDRYKKDIPFSAFSSAFRELMKIILSLPDGELLEWKEVILSLLGRGGKIIIDLIPELELITGPLDYGEEKDLSKRENRLRFFLRRFIQLFCSREHPLVLFLDDLQWADGASLKLLEIILNDDNIDYFLFFGSYRRNEIIAGHLLKLTMNNLRKENIPFKEINLSPLSSETVKTMVSHILHVSEEKVSLLSDTVKEKTGGNPFFIKLFLKYFSRSRKSLPSLLLTRLCPG